MIRCYLAVLCLVLPVQAAEVPDNPAIDPDKHFRLVAEAAEHRTSRRLTEQQFIERSAQPGTVVLDARSKEKYEELHVRGAMHLSFPDITILCP